MAIMFRDYLAKLPKKEREAIMREAARLKAECEAMHAEEAAASASTHTSKPTTDLPRDRDTGDSPARMPLSAQGK